MSTKRAVAEPTFSGGAVAPDAAWERRLGRARLVFRLCLAYTVAITAVWAFLMATGADGGLFFGNYRITLEQIAGFAA